MIGETTLGYFRYLKTIKNTLNGIVMHRFTNDTWLNLHLFTSYLFSLLNSTSRLVDLKKTHILWYRYVKQEFRKAQWRCHTCSSMCDLWGCSLEQSNSRGGWGGVGWGIWGFLTRVTGRDVSKTGGSETYMFYMFHL